MTKKNKFQLMTLTYIEDDPHVIFKNTIIEPTKTFYMLGLTVLSWKSHIQQINIKSTPAKLGFLFRCRPYFLCEQLFRINIGLILPYLEYCSHVWGTLFFTKPLDRVESKICCLINAPKLTSQLPSLKLRSFLKN